PALTSPASVIFPVHTPPPARSPVAVNFSGSGAGVFVRPGLTENVPVGASGVPPHVQVVLACAAAGPPPARTRHAAASAVMPIVARNLILIASPWCVLTSSWLRSRR